MSSIPNNLFAPKGFGYNTATSVSHFYDPIVEQKGSPRGNSRKSGDASIATKTAIINTIIQEAAAHNLTVDDTALLLSIVRTESGFNPDAAAGGNSSATGIGQMTDPTAAPYGINSANRWDLSAQAKATVELFVHYKNLAKKDGLDSSRIYAFWHDGPGHHGIGRVGVKLSNKDVMPNVSEYKAYLESGNFGLATASGNGTAPQATAGLEGKTPVERAQHHAAPSSVKMLIALGILLSALIFQNSQAAVDDAEFNECFQELDQRPDLLATDAWHKAPLDTRVAQFIEPLLYGSVVIRWISHKNQNGTTTISVLARDPNTPLPADDPDSFYVILEQHDHLSLKANVGAHAFSFLKEGNEGVNSFLFCVDEVISEVWTWNGNDWETSK